MRPGTPSAVATPEAMAMTSRPNAAPAVIAAVALATLNRPGSRTLASIVSSPAVSVNVEPSGQSARSSATTSAEGFSTP